MRVWAHLSSSTPWPKVPLGELGMLLSGQSPSSAMVNGEGRGTLYVSGPEQWDGHKVHADKWTTEPKRIAPSGSIFITVKGAGVGKIFRGIEAAIGRDIYAFVPDKRMSPRYVEHALRYSVQGVLRHAAGDIPGLSRKHILEHKIPVPPCNVQEELVAEIDKQFSRLDEAVENLKRVEVKLKHYRAAVLKAAVEGKLTEQWRKVHPDVEPASKLLERILVDRRKKWEEAQIAKYAAARKVPPKGWKDKYPEPLPPNTSHLGNLPTAWQWTTLGRLVSRSEYGTSVKCAYGAPHSPVLRIPNIIRGSVHLGDLKSATLSIRMEPGDELLPGDLLMCRTNGSIKLIGKSALIRASLDKPYAFASYLLRFRFVNDTAIPWWAHLYVGSQLGRRFIESRAASSAGQHNISLSTLHEMPIPLPPHEEQQEIVELVDQRFTVTDKASDEIEVQLVRASRLRQSILKRAFEGKLVPQDPNDEPASVLLERIRAERASKASSNQPGRRRTRAG